MIVENGRQLAPAEIMRGFRPELSYFPLVDAAPRRAHSRTRAIFGQVARAMGFKMESAVWNAARQGVFMCGGSDGDVRQTVAALTAAGVLDDPEVHSFCVVARESHNDAMTAGLISAFFSQLKAG
jgi:hypothetical protein